MGHTRKTHQEYYRPISEEEKKAEQVEHQEVENATDKRECEDAEDRDSPDKLLNIDIEVINDIALWPTIFSDAIIDRILKHKQKNIGNIENLKSVYKDRDDRGVSYNHFYRKKSNGIMEKRTWLIFSETSKNVYCYPCKLFSKSKSKLITGLQNWRSMTVILSDHEVSKEHMSAMCTLYKRSTKFNRIATQLLQEKEKEECYWREVLIRIVSTIKLLSHLGLGFRGHVEGKDSNRKGNYLTCLEYLSEYDGFLKLHLQKYANQGQGKVNCLSHDIYDEFVGLIGNQICFILW